MLKDKLRKVVDECNPESLMAYMDHKQDIIILFEIVSMGSVVVSTVHHDNGMREPHLIQEWQEVRRDIDHPDIKVVATFPLAAGRDYVFEIREIPEQKANQAVQNMLNEFEVEIEQLDDSDFRTLVNFYEWG